MPKYSISEHHYQCAVCRATLRERGHFPRGVSEHSTLQATLAGAVVFDSDPVPRTSQIGSVVYVTEAAGMVWMQHPDLIATV
jgi:hypothetical protein